MKHSYFLIFRVTRVATGPVSPVPIGGLVLKPKRVCAGVSVPDLGLAEELAEIRYHCSPKEMLIVEEVTEEREKNRARRLHIGFERDFDDFIEIMQAGK